jgi:hypothetical protein
MIRTSPWSGDMTCPPSSGCTHWYEPGWGRPRHFVRSTTALELPPSWLTSGKLGRIKHQCSNADSVSSDATAKISCRKQLPVGETPSLRSQSLTGNFTQKSNSPLSLHTESPPERRRGESRGGSANFLTAKHGRLSCHRKRAPPSQGGSTASNFDGDALYISFVAEPERSSTKYCSKTKCQRTTVEHPRHIST